jgi:hypothetical protein
MVFIKAETSENIVKPKLVDERIIKKLLKRQKGGSIKSNKEVNNIMFNLFKSNLFVFFILLILVIIFIKKEK